MAEETLESLAARVEALEKLVLGQRQLVMLPSGHVVYPGTGDWATAFKAVDELTDYDFDAVREQNECDLKHAQGQASTEG